MRVFAVEMRMINKKILKTVEFGIAEVNNNLLKSRRI